ncbi:hypothetical protein BH20ACT21_BH20ACT21_25790 [soil metagenome]
MTPVEEFVASVLPQFTKAEIALHNGDLGPRLEMWSRSDPATLLGAAVSGSGWSEVEPIFRWVANSFAGCRTYDLELVAVDVSAISHTQWATSALRRSSRMGQSLTRSYARPTSSDARRASGRSFIAMPITPPMSGPHSTAEKFG